jgi:tetratricopeptide (TPR) repeat protein
MIIFKQIYHFYRGVRRHMLLLKRYFLIFLFAFTCYTGSGFAQRSRKAEKVEDPEGRMMNHGHHDGKETKMSHDGHSAGHDHLEHIQAYRKETAFVHHLPPASVISGIGKSNLKIDTKSAKAQAFFSQGVSLLHCFWDFEAYRAFKEAIRNDSSAIMPYWGLYSAIGAIEGNDFDADKSMAIRRLKQLKSSASQHDQLYAQSILLRDQVNGQQDYQKQLELIIHKYPQDTDAKLFLALSKMSGYDLQLNPKDGQMYAEYLLRDVLRNDPNNAAANHYWIHLKENCCPEEALAEAKKLPSLAPGSGHMVHMPGHIYYKTGDYQKANEAFMSAVRVDSAYMKDQHIPEVDAWNFIHNVNYLLSNCAEDGRYNTALYYAERLKNMPVSKERKQKYEGRFFYQGIIAPAKMELCFAFYDKAAARLQAIHNTDSIFSGKAMAYKDAMFNFASGMDRLKRGKISEAIQFSDALDAGLWRNINQLNEKDNIAIKRLNDLNVASLELQGLIKSAENNYPAAMQLLEKAKLKEDELGYSEPPSYARPVLISLAETQLRFGKYDEAIAAYNELLIRHPNSANPLWGLYKVYKKRGDTEKAMHYKERLSGTIMFGDKSLFPD